jgi:LysM repeat protein
MSAMRAAELPELPEPPAARPEPPAALPQDTARNRAASRWTGPVESAAAAPDHAARPQPTRSQVGNQAGSQARSQPASAPLRLTRRGRVVVAIAVTLLLAALSLVIAASAQATNHPVPRGAQQGLTQVTVRPGQSLWSVAENADPDADTRVVIQQILELNGLTGNVVFAGQRLWVPRG